MRRALLLFVLIFSAAYAQTGFADLAKQADAARDHERLAEAVGLYRRALKLKPSWAEGWWSLGTILYDTDRHAECASAFTRFVALKPDAAPAHALLGLCEFGRGNYDAALRSLFRAQELGIAPADPIRRVALYHTALALILKQNFEKALEELALLAAAGPAPEQVRIAAGLAGLRMPILPEKVAEPDRDLVTRVGEAMTAELERRPDEALRLFETILAAYPKAPQVRYLYGSLLLNSDPAKGLKLLQEELEINPENVPAMAVMAFEYLRENDAAAARPYAEKAARLAPGDFVVRTAYGRVLVRLGDLAPAIQELEAAVRLAPDSPEAHFALANAYANAGRRDDADRERKEFSRLRNLLDSGRK